MKKFIYITIIGVIILGVLFKDKLPVSFGSVSVFKVQQGGTNSSSFAANSVVTSNSSGSSLQATGTQLTVGNLIASSSGTSIFRGNLNVDGTTRLATSFSGLLKSTTGTVSVASNGTDYTLVSGTTCSGSDKVSAISSSGSITCTTDQTGGSGTFSFSATTNYGVQVYSTSTPTLWFQSGLYASSTSRFDVVTVASTTATSSIANFGGERDASMYSGSDICAKANNAYSVAKDRSVNVLIPAGDYSCATAISMNTANKHVWLHGKGDAITKITYTGQATSTVIDTGEDGYASRLSDLTIMGTSTTDTAPGIELGGINGFAYSQVENVNVSNFGKNISIGNNTYITKFHNVVSNFARYSALTFEYDTNSGENLTFDHFLGADNNQPSGSAYGNCIVLKPNTSIGTASVFFSNSSFDKCQIVVGAEVNIFGVDNHIEILGNTSTSYVPIVLNGDANNTFSWVNTRFTNGNDVSHSPSSWITKTDGDLKLSGVTINDYGGYTIPYFVSNTGSGAREYNGISRSSGTGFTTFELNSDTSATMSLFNNGNLSLGTTTVNDANTPLLVYGPTWDGSDYYQAFIGDKNYKGLSIGYDNTNNWVALHPAQPNVAALDIFLGSPYALTSGLILKTTGNVGIGTTSPWRTLSVVGTVAFNGLTSSTAGNAVCILTSKDVVTAGNTTCVTSALKTKHDISDITFDQAKSTILGLNPVQYINNEGGDARYGFIADYVKDTKLVEYSKEDNLMFKKGEVSGFDYLRYTSVLTKFVQGIYKDLQGLIARVSGLEEKLNAQQKQIDSLQEQINLLKK